MTTTAAALPGWLDPATMISGFGPWAVAGMMAVLFAECGLLIGFFLPGDTLLFLGGVLVSSAADGGQGIRTGLMPFIALLSLAAFAGNLVGYAIGRRFGPAVFSRPQARFLRREHLDRATAFFDRHGRSAVLLARFVPVVRTVATVLAGAGRMDLRRYTLWSLIGGFGWVTLVTLAGYHLGRVAFVRDHVDLVFVAAAVVVAAGLVVPALARRR